MSWIDDVHTILNKTMETANELRAARNAVELGQGDSSKFSQNIIDAAHSWAERDMDGSDLKKANNRYDELQTTKKILRGDYGAKSWKDDEIEKTMIERDAYDESENPMLSMNVDIPQTEDVKKILSGQLKIVNDTNKTGINNDNALFIVGNTYQTNDNDYYGMGWDGRPYSYTIKNNIVSEFTPLDVEEARKSIERLSNGSITTDESIDNVPTIARIYRSLEKMQRYGNGNLVPPSSTVVELPDPGGGYTVIGSQEPSGRFIYNSRTNKGELQIRGDNYPEWTAWDAANDGAKGHSATMNSDHVEAHELAHGAQEAVENIMHVLYNDLFSSTEEYNDDAYNEWNKLDDEFLKDFDSTRGMFEKAAEKAGFENINSAIRSISEYATTNLFEAFAEAYTDVLLNRGRAKKFSKELIKAYSDLADKYVEKANKLREKYLNK